MNRREALAALISLPEIGRISVARVKPKDVLVIESNEYISAATKDRIEEMLKELWPDHKCLVLDKTLKLKVFEER